MHIAISWGEETKIEEGTERGQESCPKIVVKTLEVESGNIIEDVMIDAYLSQGCPISPLNQHAIANAVEFLWGLCRSTLFLLL